MQQQCSVAPSGSRLHAAAAAARAPSAGRSVLESEGVEVNEELSLSLPLVTVGEERRDGDLWCETNRWTT